MTHAERIENHRKRIEALGLQGSDPYAGFRRCRKVIDGRPANATDSTVLLSRLARLEHSIKQLQMR